MCSRWSRWRQDRHFSTRHAAVRTTGLPLGQIADSRVLLPDLYSDSLVLNKLRYLRITSFHQNCQSFRQVLTSERTPSSPENDIHNKFSTGTRPGYNILLITEVPKLILGGTPHFVVPQLKTFATDFEVIFQPSASCLWHMTLKPLIIYSTYATRQQFT
jgi:hypothetical protein